jgi:hypothetical protein
VLNCNQLPVCVLRGVCVTVEFQESSRAWQSRLFSITLVQTHEQPGCLWLLSGLQEYLSIFCWVICHLLVLLRFIVALNDIPMVMFMFVLAIAWSLSLPHPVSGVCLSPLM